MTFRIPDVNWNSETNQGDVFSYFVSGAACSEVEVDCLTGEYQVLVFIINTAKTICREKFIF